MRKLISGMMAAAVSLCLTVPAFAATGYGDYIILGNSYTPPSAAQISQSAANSISQAVSSGASSAKVSIRNATSISSDTIRSVASQASNAGIKAIIHADKVEGRTIINRWYIDPDKASSLSGSINLEVKTDAGATRATANKFAQYFKNNIAVVSLGQQGSFGMDMELALKVDLSHMDLDNLNFYSYDKATNTYVALGRASYYMDANGYLHFTTNVGNDIVISEGALAVK